MTDFALARRNMIDGQLRPNRVTNAQLLAAIAELPRERFLPDGLSSVAYADEDVPLGNGRYLMSRWSWRASSRHCSRQRGQGTGRGLGHADTARPSGTLVKSVVAVESDARLASSAEQTIEALGIGNVHSGHRQDGGRLSGRRGPMT